MSTSLRVGTTVARGSARGAPASFLRHAGEVARSFGFKHVQELRDERERGAYTFAKAAAHCAAAAKVGEPALAYFASPSPAYVPHEARAAAKYSDLGEFGLIIFGSEESLAEVLLIRTLATVLGEWGAPVRVRLNAMGDRDSKARFARELSAYLRKHHDIIDDHCRAALAGDPAGAYHCRNESCRDVLRGGPRAMNFLSEKSRAHFREVLERAEAAGLSYELDDMLMGDERDSRVVFALDAVGDATVLGAHGGRYDDFASRPGAKGPAVAAASIYFRKGGLPASSFMPATRAQAPKIFFIQLGLRAKLQGFAVVDMLRRAQVPTLQSFDPSGLAQQLAAAKHSGAQHLVIMGAREAMDGTVLLRAMDNSSQAVVPVKDLLRAIKPLL